jgi:hypothetical protein
MISLVGCHGVQARMLWRACHHMMHTCVVAKLLWTPAVQAASVELVTAFKDSTVIVYCRSSSPLRDAVQLLCDPQKLSQLAQA